MTVKQIQHLLGYLGTSQGRPRKTSSGIADSDIINWNREGMVYYTSAKPPNRVSRICGFGLSSDLTNFMHRKRVKAWQSLGTTPC